MELRIATWINGGFMVEIAVDCIKCGEPVKVCLENLGYHDMAKFKDIFVTCPCGMKFYPPVENMQVKDYVNDYQRMIWDCLRDDQDKGIRRAYNRVKRWKNRIPMNSQVYLEQKFGA